MKLENAGRLPRSALEALAKRLGRTAKAVKHRRTMLRKRAA